MYEILPEAAFRVGYKIFSLPQAGILLRDGTTLVVGDEFSQEDINKNRVTYQHTRQRFQMEEDTDFFEFQIIWEDGIVDSEELYSQCLPERPIAFPENGVFRFPITIKILPSPTGHGGTIPNVRRGSTHTITNENLIIESTDSLRSEIRFSILNAPQHGTILLNGKPTEKFTQTDIDLGLVAYRHNNSGIALDNIRFTVCTKFNKCNVVPLTIQVIDTFEQTTNPIIFAPCGETFGFQFTSNRPDTIWELIDGTQVEPERVQVVDGLPLKWSLFLEDSIHAVDSELRGDGYDKLPEFRNIESSVYWGGGLPQFIALSSGGFLNTATRDYIDPNERVFTPWTLPKYPEDFKFKVKATDPRTGDTAIREYTLHVTNDAPKSQPVLVRLETQPKTIPEKTPVRLVATVLPQTLDDVKPKGSVRFLLDNLPISTSQVIDGQASFTHPSMPFGLHYLIAEYSGDDTYARMRTSINFDTTSDSMIIISSSSPSAFYGVKPTITVVVRPVSVNAPASGFVKIFLNGTQVKRALLENGRQTYELPVLNVGAHTIKVEYEGNRFLTPSEQEYTQQIIRSPVTLRATTPTNQVNIYDQGQIIIDATSRGTIPPEGSVRLIPRFITGGIQFVGLVNGKATFNTNWAAHTGTNWASSTAFINYLYDVQYLSNTSFDGATTITPNVRVNMLVPEMSLLSQSPAIIRVNTDETLPAAWPRITVRFANPVQAVNHGRMTARIDRTEPIRVWTPEQGFHNQAVRYEAVPLVGQPAINVSGTATFRFDPRIPGTYRITVTYVPMRQNGTSPGIFAPYTSTLTTTIVVEPLA